jgi:hypothetical protein
MHTSPINETVVLGILPGAASLPDSPSDAQVSVPPCGADYWSAEALRVLQAR